MAWEACAEDMMITDGPGLRPPDNTRVTSPGPRYEIRFAPLYACAFVVKGDRLVHRQGAPNDNWLYSSLGAYQIHRVQSRLQARDPEWCISIYAIKDQGRPLVMTYDLTLDRTGAMTVSIPLCPMADLLSGGARIIDATDRPASSSPSASHVTVRIINGDGTDLCGAQLMLSSATKRLGIRSGVAEVVPVGRYRVTAMEAAVNNSLPRSRELDIAPGSTVVDLALTRELRRVRLTKSSPLGLGGTPDSDGQLVIESASGGRMSLMFGREPFVEVFLPIGRMTATLLGGQDCVARVEFDVLRQVDSEITIPIGRR